MIDTLKQKFINDLKSVETLEALEALRVFYLGKQGLVTEELKKLSSLSIEEKKTYGFAVNQFKNEAQQALQEKRDILEEQKLIQKLTEDQIDVTLPSYAKTTGSHHPVTMTIREITHYFSQFGFIVESGPDIDSEYHNFDALNIPSHHPARQSHDTFYINKSEKLLLRTHTSTTQIRAMTKKHKPPVRILAPGRVYRADYDATHLPMFQQMEGFVIDHNINVGHLKGTLIDFCRHFFGIENLPVRLRPSFFPFTEPSFEVDIGCDKNRKIGNGGHWMEILGCGMIHPNVIQNIGLNPNHFQGFAFGMGMERLAMLKYGVTDIRSFVSGDIRFSEAFAS